MTYKVKAGVLDKRVTILNNDLTDYKKVWASVRPITTRESLENGGQIISDTFTVLIRYIKGINSSFKLKYKDNIYDITNIEINTEYLVLTCTYESTNNDSIYPNT